MPGLVSPHDFSDEDSNKGSNDDGDNKEGNGGKDNSIRA